MKFAPCLVIGLIFFLFFTGMAFVVSESVHVVVGPGVPHDISGISSNMTLVWNSSLGIFEPGNISGGGGAESDPVFTNHTAYTLQSGWMTNWNTSYTWANSLYNTIGLKDLTSAEVDQLENIGLTTISAGQWGYVGDMDQGVSTNDDVSFNSTQIQDKGMIWWEDGSDNLTIQSITNLTFITDSDSSLSTFDMDEDGIWTSRFQPGARARLAVGQAIPASIWVKLLLTVVDHDTNNDFDVVNNRFIVPKVGIYQISYSAKLEIYSGAGSFISAIYINGVLAGGYEICHDISETTGQSANSGCDIQLLNKNDFIELYVWHNYDVGTRVCPAVTYSNYIAVQKIA